MHTPVFADEAVAALAVRTGGTYIDGTAGEGGHLNRIAAAGGRVLGLDYDAEQITRLKQQIAGDNPVVVNANFRDILSVANAHGFAPADGILLDLGLSYRQLMEGNIGLSYNRPEELLDMRIEGKGNSAADILNTYTDDELSEMLIRNAEEPNATPIAISIVRRRKTAPFRTVGDLLGVLPQHTVARVFQALRMEVNFEIHNLRKALHDSVQLLVPGGRLVIITFHSLEDRIVKLFGRNTSGLKGIKAQIPKKERASFERSAQLRIFEKTK